MLGREVLDEDPLLCNLWSTESVFAEAGPGAGLDEEDEVGPAELEEDDGPAELEEDDVLAGLWFVLMADFLVAASFADPAFARRDVEDPDAVDGEVVLAVDVRALPGNQSEEEEAEVGPEAGGPSTEGEVLPKAL